MSAKETLEETYQKYVSWMKIYESAKERTQRDKNFAPKVIPPGKSKKTPYEHQIIADYFDQLYTEITELYILNIITTFERMVFNKIDNAYGVIKDIVTVEYNKRYSKKDKPAPLYHSAVSFIKVKEDIHNLSGARKVLEKQITEELSEDLKEIIEYRNWLSHGKRRNVGEASILTIEQIKEILMKIIDEIE
ncbi:MAG: hypothetical protein GY749_01710 [Desulfobacteraceae bacterium]|nr:hypothetical protein [Desulfobacteraceae bacterium]MCP4345787.1 hypothetical protein [Desulfobacterales bacterium]